jgi:hypothetical protein
MKREHLKDLLEGIGIIAIIASLIFVGIETRNSTKQAALNTQALEIAAYQELMDNIAEMNTLIVQDPEVAAFMHKVYFTSDELTELEQFRFTRAAYLRFRHGDMAFFQYQRGAIDETRLQSSLKILNLSNPRVRAFWNRVQGNFVEAYRAYINQIIAEQDANAVEDL